ncbi:MAG: Leucine-rich repeat (LRR) protein [Bacteroidia bacterium]|jgi:Leucine-rich repeat (LRR) protein
MRPKFEGISHLVVWGNFPCNLKVTFPDVQHLFIFNSRITKGFISEEFNFLRNLKSLELYECGNAMPLLSQLNKCCPTLEKLSLSAMPITKIPKNIFYLKNLEEVNLYFLDINLLNPQILNLKSLKKITIQEMPISNIDTIIRICKEKHIILLE